jgi:putative phosphoribosyl transferase
MVIDMHSQWLDYLTPFEDRTDAGDKLGKFLERYREGRTLVLAIPKGGIAVGSQVAAHLGAELSVVVVRKLPFPDNPESGFGAIAEDGSLYVNETAASLLPEYTIDDIIKEQVWEIRRRIGLLRAGRPLPDMAGRTVILVDDGIAMGSTMRAAILLCRNRRPGSLVAGVPVAGEKTARRMKTFVDDFIVLVKPWNFHAVAQVYANWHDVSDAEALHILKKHGVI